MAIEPARSGEYTRRPTKMRLYTNPNPDYPNGIEWMLDAVDADNYCTDECWSFDTFEEAVAALPEFWEDMIRLSDD